MEYKISIPYDEDGYTTLQCPYCREKFKVKNDEFLKVDSRYIYCPVCGLTNSISNFYTKDIYDKALEIAENEMYKLFNKAFKGIKSSKCLKITTNELKSDKNKVLRDTEYGLEITEAKCCKIHIKVRKIDNFIGAYCPYCGRDNIE